MAAADVFYRVVTEAINDILEHGFDAEWRIQQWTQRLSEAMRHSLTPLGVVDGDLRKLLLGVFASTTRHDRLMRLHKGVSPYTLQQIQPRLRAELDRRILASAELIKLNREAAITKTLQRYAGWATSIPAGGTEAEKRAPIRKEVRRGIAGLPFDERRVVIDQGHKLVSAVNEIVAVDGGALGGFWRSHWRESGYNYRPDHKAMDGKFYVLRDNWALRDGLMKLAGHQYTDQVDAPGGPVFCRCYLTYVYSLRDLPAEMLTEHGRNKLSEARAQIRGFGAAA